MAHDGPEVFLYFTIGLKDRQQSIRPILVRLQYIEDCYLQCNGSWLCSGTESAD